MCVMHEHICSVCLLTREHVGHLAELSYIRPFMTFFFFFLLSPFLLHLCLSPDSDDRPFCKATHPKCHRWWEQVNGCNVHCWETWWCHFLTLRQERKSHLLHYIITGVCSQQASRRWLIAPAWMTVSVPANTSKTWPTCDHFLISARPDKRGSVICTRNCDSIGISEE